jgi:hypothetical protein
MNSRQKDRLIVDENQVLRPMDVNLKPNPIRTKSKSAADRSQVFQVLLFRVEIKLASVVSNFISKAC